MYMDESKKKLVLSLIETALKQELLEKRFVDEGFLVEPRTENKMSMSNLFYEVVSGLQEAIFTMLEIQGDEGKEEVYFSHLAGVISISHLSEKAEELLNALIE